jgi:Ca2+-binding EF-hand superfamily protein
VKQLSALLQPTFAAAPKLNGDNNRPTVNLQRPLSADEKQKREAMFKRRDKNGDGKLTLEEFLVGQPDPQEAPKRFPIFDTNNDGVLTEEEFVNAGRTAK